MKKSFFVLLSLFIVLSINAQVVINYNSHAPINGTNNVYCGIDFIDPGQSGKNVIWDLSQINQTNESRKTNFNIANQVDADKFKLNVSHVLSENNMNFFQNLTTNSYSITGFINDDFIIHYAEPLIVMQYPFTYTDKFEGSLVATALNTRNSETEIDGHYNVSADAYGQIILPGNIVKKVLRVHKYSTQVQVSRCREVNVETSKYFWYSADDRYPIATTIIQEKRFCNGDIQTKKETFVNQKYLKVNAPETDELFTGKKYEIQVFPNPFVDKAELMFDLFDNASVEIVLCNLVGKELHTIQSRLEMEKGQYFYKIKSDELSLTPGMYFVKVIVANEIESVKLIRK